MGGTPYDVIGRGYARHRRPDERIAAQVRRAVGDAPSVINVGAGAGSYEHEDRPVLAVEPSALMVSQRPEDGPPVGRAEAAALPVRRAAFGAATALLTVHHWADPHQGLRELVRVARRVVVFTFDPPVHFGYWLFTEYLPEAAALPSAGVPGVDAIATSIGADRVEVVPVPADCRDGFNWAYWRRPERYLDPSVRACISGFAELPPGLVERRMEQLRRDLADGAWLDRHRSLLERDEIDGGFRLVVRS